MAMGGVGRPMNEVVCRVSTLNLARRTAENTGSRKARQAKSETLPTGQIGSDMPSHMR